MSFEAVLKTDIKKGFNSADYRKASKDRPHISKGKMDEYSNAVYVTAGEYSASHYKDDVTSKRYICALDITYDLIVSIFDVNTRALIVYRIFKLSELDMENMVKFARSLRSSKPNMEARIIGLQNNQDYEHVARLADMIIANNINLVEVDLFGTNKRHIAIDAKLGSSYNILNEDRLYRPGELVNSLTMENFEAGLKVQKEEKKEVPPK